MGAPLFQSSDYLAAFQALMPRGLVWPRDTDATQTQALSGLMPTYERQNAAANGLLVDAFPPTTNYLLPEWNQTLGFPDPNAGPAPTLAKAQQQVAVKFANGGGQSVAYYKAYAAQFGFSLHVKPKGPFRMGTSMGQQLGGSDWAHAWEINAYASTAYLGDWDAAILASQIAAMAPAHTILTINVEPMVLTNAIVTAAGSPMTTVSGAPLMQAAGDN